MTCLRLIKTATVPLLLACLASAQPIDDLKALRKEVLSIKEGQTAIQKDIEEIKKLLEPLRQRTPEPFKEAILTLDGAPIKGDKNAKVTVVEFTDYQCPFCARHVTGVMPQLLKEYVDTGKVRYILRDFPLTSIHPAAAKAAEAALCAGEEGKYWEYHDRMFQNQKALNPPDLVAHAEALGLKTDKFRQCLDGGKFTERVQQNAIEGNKAGVRGTPSFFMGLTDPSDNKLKATKLVRGAVPYAQLKQAIDELLSQEAGEKKSKSE